MKTIHVVAAIIKKGHMVLATERGYGKYATWWEVPGGKVEQGENELEALNREIFEELSATIAIKEHFITVEHDYPDFHLRMSCYLCELTSKGFMLNEHYRASWVGLKEIDSLKWLEADEVIIAKLKEEQIIQ